MMINTNKAPKRTTDPDVAVATSPPLGKKIKFHYAQFEEEMSPTRTTATLAAAVANFSKPRNPSILTFTAEHNDSARLQLLSTNTLYDLVSTLCRYTLVGNEGPDAHMWHINYNGRSLWSNNTKLEDLNLEKGCTLMLIYAYGNASAYNITLEEIKGLGSQDALTLFPRNKPKPRIMTPNSILQTYQKYQPNAGDGFNLLDDEFFYLNDWLFRRTKTVSMHLFQAGRKKNYGFMDNKFTMMYLPAKPDSLANWLECFNRSACLRPAGLELDGYAHYTWQSVVALPRSKLSPQLTNKYKSNEKLGFCDAPIVEDHSYYAADPADSLENLFPKIAALAGLRKDKYVPKGWISFTKDGDKCSLTICRGNAREPKNSKAPKGLAFEGENQHCPVEEPLFQIKDGLEISGLHDLFCVVEGLLRTL